MFNAATRLLVLALLLVAAASPSLHARQPPRAAASPAALLRARAPRAAAELSRLLDPAHRTRPGHSSRLLAALRLFRRHLSKEPLPRFEEALPYNAPTMACEDSTQYPVKVCYFEPGQKSIAATIVGMVDAAWKKQIVELGFARPWAGPDLYEPLYRGLNVYLEQGTKPKYGPYTAYGMVVPVDLVATTARSDMSSFMKIGFFQGTVDLQELQLLIHHEFNHACQLATDYRETTFAKEATAQWVQALMGPTDKLTVEMKTFQAHPHFPLSYHVRTGANATYQYGGFMWLRFLVEAYFADDPVVVRKIWDGAVQDEAATGNPVSIFESTVTLLGPSRPLSDALHLFGQWRYFVGARHRGGLFEHGAHYPDVDVYQTSSLSALGESKQLSAEVHPMGYRYLELENDLSEVPRDLEVRVSGNGTRFGFAVFALDDGALVAERHQRLDPQGGDSRALVVPASVVQRSKKLVVMLARHAGAGAKLDELDLQDPRAMTVRLAWIQSSIADAGVADSAAGDSGGGDVGAHEGGAATADAGSPSPSSSGCSVAGDSASTTGAVSLLLLALVWCRRLRGGAQVGALAPPCATAGSATRPRSRRGAAPACRAAGSPTSRTSPWRPLAMAGPLECSMERGG